MAKSSFKLEHPLERRQAEASRIREKYSDRIPVIVEKAGKSDIPDIDEKKVGSHGSYADCSKTPASTAPCLRRHNSGDNSSSPWASSSGFLLSLLTSSLDWSEHSKEINLPVLPGEVMLVSRKMSTDRCAFSMIHLARGRSRVRSRSPASSSRWPDDQLRHSSPHVCQCFFILGSRSAGRREDRLHLGSVSQVMLCAYDVASWATATTCLCQPGELLLPLSVHFRILWWCCIVCLRCCFVGYGYYLSCWMFSFWFCCCQAWLLLVLILCAASFSWFLVLLLCATTFCWTVGTSRGCRQGSNMLLVEVKASMMIEWTNNERASTDNPDGSYARLHIREATMGTTGRNAASPLAVRRPGPHEERDGNATGPL